MTVYLIGDSIRLNAESTVRALLGDDIAVVSPRENCESSTRVRQHIAAWVPATVGDVVHLNCGLHDLRHDPGRQAPVNTLDVYTDNLSAIFSALADTGATVVWAASTPIDEERHNRNKASRRYAADVLAYNARSVELANAHGFVVHDLHATVLRHSFHALLLEDGVHFNDAGNAVVGTAIAEAIRAQLPQSR